MNLLHQVGIYLCDMKPANVLVVMDNISAEKYHPILTDLGGACDRKSEGELIIKYPRLTTTLFFS